MDVPTIPEFFSGKRIFITGATGFMGKVLVEKLLRSCNDLDTLYVLIRGKKGKTAEERWADASALPCFDRLKTMFPSALEAKVKVMEGDVRESKLGLSSNDYQTLINNTDVIFHVAASVRFNDSLPEAIKMNTCGTLHVVQLAAEIKHLLALVHVSTTYCYCNKMASIDEEIYPVNMDWKTAVEITEKADPVNFDILSYKFTDFAPNTYVYSKSLAEQIINDHKNQIPVVIFRPSIVISSWKEPIPGWIDNFNGPIGLIIAGGKGVVRITLCDPDAVPDYMAVDISIKALIIAAWKKGIQRASLDRSEKQPLGTLEVYNSSSTSSKSISNAKLIELSKIVNKMNPIDEVLWVPSYSLTKSFAVYRFWAFFSHFLMAVVTDSLLRIFGQKPMLLKIHIKIHMAMMALGYFTTKEWTFRNNKFRALNDAVLPQDREHFDFSFDNLAPLEYFVIAAQGGKRFLLHEDISNTDKALKKQERLYFIDQALRWLLSIGLIYIAYCRLIA